MKAIGCAEGCYHLIFNHAMESNSDLVWSNAHKGCCVLDTTNYNYKLRSVIGQEDDYKVKKWIWSDKQVRDIFYTYGWYHEK